MHEDAAAPVSAEAQPAQAAAAAVAPDVAEAAAAAAFELPVHAIQPLPVAPAAAPAERQERASGDGADDDGFEFGSDAASDSSSSWTSSDEETGAPISSAALPAWLARRTAGGSDVDDDEDEAPARVPPAAEPEAPALVLLPVEPTDEIRLAGTILSVVGAMIVVQAAKDEALLDDGSTICFENRTPLGQVDETFGPVQAPLYAVRRCQVGDAPAAPPAIGERVFFVVNRSNFIEDVAKLHVKGYDASGKDDAEVEEEEEFSDDEKEAEARQQRKQKRQPRPEGAVDALGDGTVLPNAPRPRGAGRGRGQQQRQPAGAMQPPGMQGYPGGMPHPGMAYGGPFPMAYGPMGAMPWPGFVPGQVPFPPGAWGMPQVPMGWTPAWPQAYPGPGPWGFPPQPPQ